MGHFNIATPCESTQLPAASDFSRPSTPASQLVDPIAFFSFVKPDGYPEEIETPAKAQPWRDVFAGPVPPKDGKLLIACPKGADWGSGSGLGGY